MAYTIVEDYVIEHGPLTPREMADLWRKEQFTPITEEAWRSTMESSDRLAEDDSGRFHLKDG